MVENRPLLNFVTHAILILGVAIVALPIWITFVAATHDEVRMMQGPIPVLPGSYFWANLKQTFWGSGLEGTQITPVWRMLFNSLVMALMIAGGKITISLLSAFAIVYFKFPFRMVFFWMIFVTLMLPVEVRIIPTYEVVASLGMLNSYWGLTVPLIASATATFMFRQVFLTIPDEMLESARIDGAGPMRFFWDILFPMSRTNIAALFVILFIYGWNQYLWPRAIIDNDNFSTLQLQLRTAVAENVANANVNIASALVAALPA